MLVNVFVSLVLFLYVLLLLVAVWLCLIDSRLSLLSQNLAFAALGIQYCWLFAPTLHLLDVRSGMLGGGLFLVLYVLLLLVCGALGLQPPSGDPSRGGSGGIEYLIAVPAIVALGMLIGFVIG